ncbi:MAG: hypothetical protein HKN82_15475 [Akkermansiaceae bacterium]|nr:hypothetical protein [Akkermansiaceae bacterium]
MKSTLTTLILATSMAMAAPSDYVNFVRQIQKDFEWDITVAPSGSMLSAEGIDEDGSQFLLFSVHSTLGIEYLLDDVFVSTYTPEAKLAVVTEDPYDAIPRTRVDRPFSISVNIKGMTHAAPAAGDVVLPAAAQKVLLSHKAYNYPEGVHSLEGRDNPAEIDVGTALLRGNGTTVINYATNHLTAPDLTKAEGEEVWTISALNDWGWEGEVLESKKVQIWPIADASITGIDPNKRYSNLPPINVKYNDLYPASETWVHIYPGPPVANATNFTDIPDGYWKAVDSVPESPPAKVLTGIDHLFPEEGAYTMEVVHQTPFGLDVLTQFYPIRVDRTVEFKGGLYTAE